MDSLQYRMDLENSGGVARNYRELVSTALDIIRKAGHMAEPYGEIEKHRCPIILIDRLPDEDTEIALLIEGIRPKPY